MEKNLKRSKCITALAVTCLIIPSYNLTHAEDTKEASPKMEIKKSELTALSKKQHLEANTLVAQINLAALALDLGLSDEASKHLKLARVTVDSLEKVTEKFTSEEMQKYGILSYTQDGVKKVRYVPIFNDTFVAKDYEPVFHVFSKEQIIEEGAAVVNVNVSLDIENVKKAITETEKELNDKQLTKASEALAKVADYAVISEEVITDPIWIIHDNLVLAENLIKEKNFSGARIALATAKDRLSNLEEIKGLSDKEKKEGQKLEGDINNLLNEIKVANPSISEKIGKKLKEWAHVVKAWM